MSGRPSDWSPVWDGDPVPGDPVEVTDAGRHYLQIAQSIRDATRNLLAVTQATAETSEALNAFREKLGDVRSDLLKVESRYEGLGNALLGYAPSLASAQGSSAAALDAGRESAAQQRLAVQAQEHAAEQMPYAADPEAQRQLAIDQAVAANRAAAAEEGLATARARIAEAIAARDEAARTAAAAISDVETASAVTDSHLDRVKDAIGDFAVAAGKFLDAVAEILDKLSTILAILQVVLIVVSFICPAAALALGALKALLTILSVVSRIARVVKALQTTARVIRIVMGREKYTWQDAARDTVGLVVGKVAERVTSDLVDEVGDRLGEQILTRAHESLELSQKMRFVRAGLSDPGGKASAWSDGVFPDGTFEEMLDLADSSTDYGREAISEAFMEKWVLDESADLVGGAIDDLAAAGADAAGEAISELSQGTWPGAEPSAPAPTSGGRGW